MSAHTPGPFHVLQNSKGADATKFLVVAEGSERLVALARVARAADADLFAAAPDLLAALEELTAAISEQVNHISKANGWPPAARDAGTQILDGLVGVRTAAGVAIAKARGTP